MPKRSGFTLIELLVVITILAIITVAFIVNFGSFDEDANLKNMATDLQSYFRLAQANAQSGVKCQDGTGGAWWSLIINSRDQNAIHLRCGTATADERFWSINPPALIYSIDDVSSQGILQCNSSFTPEAVSTIAFRFSYLSGEVSVEDPADDCLKKNRNIAVTFRKKIDSPDFMTVTINKGGAVNVK